MEQLFEAVVFLLQKGLCDGNITLIEAGQFIDLFPQWKPDLWIDKNFVVQHGTDIFDGTDKPQYWQAKCNVPAAKGYEPGKNKNHYEPIRVVKDYSELIALKGRETK